MIELNSRRTGMATSKAGGKGGVAVLAQPVSSKAEMIDMKGAVKAAIAFIQEFFPGAKEILLEEVELERGYYVASLPGKPPVNPTFKEDPAWRVVTSFKLEGPGTLSEVMGGDPRLYREVYIDPDSGSLRSMRTWGK
jgi:hypothetical protein